MRLSTLLAVLPLASASPAAPAGAKVTHRKVPAHIADRYIVRFKKGSPAALVQDALKHATNHTHVYSRAMQGFAAHLDQKTIDILKFLPGVEHIEQDGVGKSAGYVVDSGSTWGLGRILHYDKNWYEYEYDESAGYGVCAYVVDSGIDDTHEEFEGRAHQLKSYTGVNYDDLGHGTHCAGTIGSRSFGVANQIELYGIKVLNGDDKLYWSDVIAGYDYLDADSVNRDCPNGVVVSVSLGGDYNESVNKASANLIDLGYFVAIAAGNNGDDTYNHSPGSEPSVCTVGAIDDNDDIYVDTNYGDLVDIMAPGVGVLSTVPGGTAYYTGTSMATPHVAGLAAYLASRDNKFAGPYLCDTIYNTASYNYINNQYDDTVNRIAFNGNPNA